MGVLRKRGVFRSLLVMLLGNPAGCDSIVFAKCSMTSLLTSFSYFSPDAWCPRRTIIFASWDAEEYGLIGSTEWVEENMQILQERAVTYINIDAAVRGRVYFYALGVPMLSNVIYSATKLVKLVL